MEKHIKPVHGFHSGSPARYPFYLTEDVGFWKIRCQAKGKAQKKNYFPIIYNVHRCGLFSNSLHEIANFVNTMLCQKFNKGRSNNGSLCLFGGLQKGF